MEVEFILPICMILGLNNKQYECEQGLYTKQHPGAGSVKDHGSNPNEVSICISKFLTTGQ